MHIWTSNRIRPAIRQGMDWLVTREAAGPPSPYALLRRYGLTLLALALVTAACEPVKAWLGLLNIGLIYLIVVVGAATLGGRGPGLLASVLGFLLFNFFLVPPYLTFFIGDPHNILALLVFLGLAVLISTLIARTREEVALARRRASDLQRLYSLSQTALAAPGREGVLPALVGQVVEMLAAEAGWLLLPGSGEELVVAGQAPSTARPPSGREWNLAQRAYGEDIVLGMTAQEDAARTVPGARALFAPLRAEGRVLGVLGVTAGARPRPFAPTEQTVLVALSGQVALALSRLELREEAARAELLERTDTLKSALLHAVSHDLRTPLASIKATVTSLLDPAMHWDPATQRVFLVGVDEECDRLTRLVGDLLDLARIEGGALHVQRDWYAIGEVIGTVRRRLASRLVDHPLTVDLPPDLPLVPIDFVKIDQVLTNLLENAIRYTPPGTPITVRAVAGPGLLAVTVADRGPGVPPHHLAHLFDKFYRVEGTGTPPGSGLGLAIAQGMVLAHGGTISARSAPGQGLTITFTLPLRVPDAPVPLAASLTPVPLAEDVDGR